MFGSAALLDELFLALAASLASYVLYTTCRLYAPPKASALASLAFSFGTSLWPFSTALFPHAASLLFLTLALCAALTYGAGKGGAQSYSWSGYMVAASPGSVTDVRGSWVVPLLSCTSSSSYVALWVGMDGFTSTTVEQTGILGECVGGALVELVARIASGEASLSSLTGFVARLKEATRVTRRPPSL